MTVFHRILAIAPLILASCGREAALAPLPASPTPTPSEAISWLAPLAPKLPPRDPVRRTPEQVQAREALYRDFGPPTTVAAAIEQAVRLQQEYQTDTEYLNRVEVIYRLADASTPQSREALSRLFFTEQDLDLRIQMVNALPFVDDGDINLSLPILQDALKPSQPRELREAALDTIQALNDVRTLPLLQPLRADPDPELRDTAEKTSIYYEEVRQLDLR